MVKNKKNPFLSPKISFFGVLVCCLIFFAVLTSCVQPLATVLDDTPVASSVVDRVVTNNSETVVPLRKVINHDNPLYVFKIYEQDDPVAMWNSIPASLKPFSAIMLVGTAPKTSNRPDGDYSDTTNRYFIWADRVMTVCDNYQIPHFVQVINGETPQSEQLPVADWEKRMADPARKYFLGVNCAEVYNSENWAPNNGNHSQYISDLIKACAKYGMYMYVADTDIYTPGSLKEGAWSRWLDQKNVNDGTAENDLLVTMKKYKDNVLLTVKESFGSPATDALFYGLWLMDYCGNWGILSDWWHWGLSGHGYLGSGGGQAWQYIASYADELTTQSIIRAANFGATVFCNEGSWFTSAIGDIDAAIDPNTTPVNAATGKTYDNRVLTPRTFTLNGESVTVNRKSSDGLTIATYQYLTRPLFERFISGDIKIPTKAELLPLMKAVVVGARNWDVPYTIEGNPHTQYANVSRDLFSKTGRYGIIPRLPRAIGDDEIKSVFGQSINIIKSTGTNWDNLYSANPNITKEQNAYVHKTGDTWWMYGINENPNDYSNVNKIQIGIRLGKFEAGSFAMNARAHTFAVVTEDYSKNRVRLYMNNYRLNKSVLQNFTLYGSSQHPGFGGGGSPTDPKTVSTGASADFTPQFNLRRFIRDFLTVKFDEFGNPVTDANGNVQTGNLWASDSYSIVYDTNGKATSLTGTSNRTNLSEGIKYLEDRTARDLTETVVKLTGSYRGGPIRFEPTHNNPGVERNYSYVETWDAGTKTLTLIFTHNGPVEGNFYLD